ncbi:hypothetical protein DOY81_008436 [Sarcophaga bullata]|nr:hypothetical protein DOY81_008436 [Sarcophaga bullata]
MLRYLTSDKTNEEGSETSAEKKKRKIKDEWINDSKIKLWAEKRNQKVYCKFCNTDLKASSGKMQTQGNIWMLQIHFSIINGRLIRYFRQNS